MKVFLSWSKSLSKAHCLCFRNWITKVFQQVEPFMSDQDISLGQRGIDIIESKLDSFDFGIVFVTRQNQDSPWIHYEAGALSRVVTAAESRVIPLLVDLEISDLAASPLSSFQGARISKSNLERLCSAINDLLDKPLSPVDFEETFEMWWPKLDNCWQSIDHGDAEQAPDFTIQSIGQKVDDLTKVVLGLRNNEADQTRLLSTLWLSRVLADSDEASSESSVSNKAKIVDLLLSSRKRDANPFRFFGGEESESPKPKNYLFNFDTKDMDRESKDDG